MGVYSGVYEYTQQIQEQIQSIQSIQVFGHLLSCRQDPCSIIVSVQACSVVTKVGIASLALSGPSAQAADDLKSRDELAGGTYSYHSEIDGRIVPAATACPTICTICCQLYHSDHCAAASARSLTAFHQRLKHLRPYRQLNPTIFIICRWVTTGEPCL